MASEKHLVIGLMSGTSVDAVDAALIETDGEAHVRGIAGWPLEQPKLLSPAVMVNVLGQHVEPTRALIADHPEWNVHDYGKAEVRHDRKMGHITVLTDDTAKTVADLEATGCWDDLQPQSAKA